MAVVVKAEITALFKLGTALQSSCLLFYFLVLELKSFCVITEPSSTQSVVVVVVTHLVDNSPKHEAIAQEVARCWQLPLVFVCLFVCFVFVSLRPTK